MLLFLLFVTHEVDNDDDDDDDNDDDDDYDDEVQVSSTSIQAHLKTQQFSFFPLKKRERGTERIANY